MCGLDCCADGTESCIEGSCVATAIDGCAVSPTYGMLNLAATAFPIGTPTNLITMEVPFPANEGSTTQLLIEARKGYGRFAEGFSTGEFELSGAELNYGTCGLCFLLHNSTEEETKRFMVTRGHVTITSVSGGFDLTLSNAAFEEVTLDASNLSTPVQDGCTVTLESAVFAGTFPPVPPNDLCGGEIALTLGALPLAGDNTYATPAYGNTPGDLSSACAPLATWGLAGKEVVYSYTPAESGPFTITVTPSRLTDLAIWYSTTCGDIATCEGGIDTLEPEETLTITGVAGIEYFIFVDTFDPTVGGPFTIQVRAAAAP